MHQKLNKCVLILIRILNTEHAICNGIRRADIMANFQNASYEDMVTIRDLVLEEPIAYEKWPRILDRIFKVSDTVRMKKLLTADFAEGVLQSLYTWHGHGERRADLLGVLRELELNRLVDKIIDQSTKLEPGHSASADGEANNNLPAFPKEKWWPHKKQLPNSFIPRKYEETGQLLVETLHDIIRATSRVAILSSNHQGDQNHKLNITGLGGVGKSTAAKWYANHYESEYDYLIWVDSEGNALATSFRRLAPDFGVKLEFTPGIAKSIEVLAEEMYATLSKAGKICLFIFDNATAKNEGNEGGLIMAYLPKPDSPHHVLITSRNQEWGSELGYGKINTLLLQVFSLDEALDFLCNNLKPDKLPRREDQMDAARVLVTQLGLLPLALQYAVSSINKSKYYTISSYLAKVQNNDHLILNRTGLDDYQLSIRHTLGITIEQIQADQEHSELCMLMLQTLAFCSPDSISVKVLDGMQQPGNDPEDIEMALDVLVQFSLVNSSTWYDKRGREYEQELSMHRLLQQTLRLQLAEAGKKTELEMVHRIFTNMTNNARMQDVQGVVHGIEVWSNIPKYKEMVELCGEFPVSITKQIMGFRNWPDYVKLKPFLDDCLSEFGKYFKESDLRMTELKELLVFGLTRDEEIVASELQNMDNNNSTTAVNLDEASTLQLHWMLSRTNDSTMKCTLTGGDSGSALEIALQQATETYANIFNHLHGGSAKYANVFKEIAISKILEIWNFMQNPGKPCFLYSEEAKEYEPPPINLVGIQMLVFTFNSPIETMKLLNQVRIIADKHRDRLAHFHIALDLLESYLHRSMGNLAKFYEQLSTVLENFLRLSIIFRKATVVTLQEMWDIIADECFEPIIGKSPEHERRLIRAWNEICDIILRFNRYHFYATFLNNKRRQVLERFNALEKYELLEQILGHYVELLDKFYQATRLEQSPEEKRVHNESLWLKLLIEFETFADLLASTKVRMGKYEEAVALCRTVTDHYEGNTRWDVTFSDDGYLKRTLAAASEKGQEETILAIRKYNFHVYLGKITDSKYYDQLEIEGLFKLADLYMLSAVKLNEIHVVEESTQLALSLFKAKVTILEYSTNARESIGYLTTWGRRTMEFFQEDAHKDKFHQLRCAMLKLIFELFFSFATKTDSVPDGPLKPNDIQSFLTSTSTYIMALLEANAESQAVQVLERACLAEPAHESQLLEKLEESSTENYIPNMEAFKSAVLSRKTSMVIFEENVDGARTPKRALDSSAADSAIVKKVGYGN